MSTKNMDPWKDSAAIQADIERKQNISQAAEELLEAAKRATELIKTSRRYFPKSIRNPDTFRLESVNAALGTAIARAEGRL